MIDNVPPTFGIITIALSSEDTTAVVMVAPSIIILQWPQLHTAASRRRPPACSLLARSILVLCH